MLGNSNDVNVSSNSRPNQSRRVGAAPTLARPTSVASANRMRTSRARFSFRQKGGHFTYKTHVPFDTIKETFMRINAVPFRWYSIVHESSDQENPYNHTHFAFEWPQRYETSDARKFDIVITTDGIAETIHPNITLFANSAHKERIFIDYHRKDPFALEQSENGPTAGRTLIQQIKDASTLWEACELAGVELKSVSDIKLLRDDTGRTPDFEHNWPNSTWNPRLRPIQRVTFISGGTGSGKSEWACAQFANPLLISTRDELGGFDPTRHDGIVFDDMDFTDWKRTDLIHLFDWDLPRSINKRYTPALIPKHTKKVVTSNIRFEEMFFMDAGIGAIRRRFTDIIYMDKGETTYVLSDAPSPLTQRGDDSPHSQPSPAAEGSAFLDEAARQPTPSDIWMGQGLWSPEEWHNTADDELIPLSPIDEIQQRVAEMNRFSIN